MCLFLCVVVYTIEFQKGGLPCSHICLFMQDDYKLPIIKHIGPPISIGIPKSMKIHHCVHFERVLDL